jgi:hypothetical protein
VLEEGMVFALETYWPGSDGWSAALVEDGLVPLGLGRSPRVKTLFDPDAAAPRAARHTGRRPSSSSW